MHHSQPYENTCDILTISSNEHLRMKLLDIVHGQSELNLKLVKHLPPVWKHVMQSFSYNMGSYERDTDFVDAGRVVDVTFLEDGSCGCVTVTETFDAEDIHDLDMQTAGRQAILENFKKCCEEK
jgi:hypothetical protein